MCHCLDRTEIVCHQKQMVKVWEWELWISDKAGRNTFYQQKPSRSYASFVPDQAFGIKFEH